MNMFSITHTCSMLKTSQKCIVIFVLAVLALLLAAPFVHDLHASGDQQKLRVGIFDNKPIVYKAEDGQPKGIYVDLLREMARLENWELEFVHDTWSSHLQHLREGDIDIMTSIAFHPERDEYMDYSTQSVMTMWGQVYVKKGNQIQNILDLEGKRVALLKDGINGINFMRLARQFNVHSEFIKADTYKEVTGMVERGEADAGVINNIHGEMLEFNFGIQHTSVMFEPFNLLFSVPEGKHSDVLAAIDKHLASWKDDTKSIYHKNPLIRNVFLRDNVREVVPVWMYSVLALSAVSLFLLVLWLVAQRKLIKEREIASREIAESEERFRKMSEATFEGILIAEKGKIIDTNQQCAEIFGYSLDEMLGKDVLDLVAPESRDLVSNMIKEGYQEAYESIALRKDGSRINIEVRGIQITYQGRKARETSIRDITERKQFEERLIKSEAKFRELIEKTPMPMSIVSLDGKFEYYNDRHLDLFGYTYDDLSSLESWWALAYPDKQYREQVIADWIALKENLYAQKDKHPVIERNITCKDGTVKIVEINFTLIGNKIITAVNDITERKKVEESLISSEDKFRSVISNSPIGIAVSNADGQCISVNSAMADIIGATKEQILKQNYHNLESWKKSGMHAKAVSAITNNKTEHIDVELKTSFGNMIYVSCFFTPIGRGELLVMMQNLSELLKTQNQLKNSLNDKDMLMKEIHHRVKNNLTVIQSLLSLQLEDITDDKSREYFHDAGNRVKSMTMIHEMLHGSDDLTQMKTKDYIERLASTLFNNYKANAQKVKLQYDIQNVVLDVDTMIPLGLIINELVTNALKYAFSDGTEGELSISLKKTVENSCELIIKDTGAGLPEDFDLKKAKTLGLLIVNSLVNQIKGTLEVSNKDGAEFRITFTEQLIN